MKNIIQSSEVYHRTSTKKIIEKILQKILTSLDEESEIEDEKEEKIEYQEDIENKMFEDVTVEERKQIYKLLTELKWCKSRFKFEDFHKINMLVSEYSKKEYGM